MTTTIKNNAMRALVWEAPKTMNMREQALPTLDADEVLIKVAYAGICGSELSGYLGHSSLRVPPLVMGHEFAGEVAALGAGVKTFAVGQRVTVNPIVACGTCDYCQTGLAHLCASRKVIGAHRPGAYAEYVGVPVRAVVPLPEEMSLRIGALAEPTACAVRIGELSGHVSDQIVLVIGAGPIGLLAMQVLQLKGATAVYVADLDTERLKMVTALGGIAINPRESDTVETVRQRTQGKGVVVSVDAVGTARTRAQCVSATRSSGTVILTGLHEEKSEMPVAEMIRREIRGQGSFAYSPANFAEAVQLLAAGKIKLDPWIVEAPLAEGGKWFDRLIEAPGNVSKVLLVP